MRSMSASGKLCPVGMLALPARPAVARSLPRCLLAYSSRSAARSNSALDTVASSCAVSSAVTPMLTVNSSGPADVDMGWAARTVAQPSCQRSSRLPGRFPEGRT